MSIYEISHISDTKYLREGRVFFGVGNCTDLEDYERKYDNNISEKNKFYCELTAIYAIHKNKNDDYIGIEHYRRTFLNSKYKLLSNKEIKRILIKKKIILPKIEKNNISNFEQFVSFHYLGDYEILRDIFMSDYKEYLPAFQKYFSNFKSHYYNMMICDKEVFDKYCNWVFDILGKVEEKIQYSLTDRVDYQKRVYGFIAERLLNIWVIANFGKEDICELPVYFYNDGRVKISFLRRLKRMVFDILKNK